MKLFYTSFTLWSIFQTLPQQPRLDPITWKNLKNAGVAKLSTRRGCRAGHNKRRKITVVLNQGKYGRFNSSSSILNSINRFSSTAFYAPLGMQICHESSKLIMTNNSLLKPIVSMPFQQSIPGSLERKVSTSERVNITVCKTVPTSYSPNIRFALWNARSIKNKMSCLCDFIISRKIDVMVITETWMNGDDRDKRTIADFSSSLPTHVFTHLPRLNRTGGGIALLVRKGLSVAVNEPLGAFTSMECLDINISSGNKNLRLISIYRPPPSSKNGLTSSMFFDDFSSLLEKLSSFRSDFLICGDFNFHMDLTDNTDTKHFNDLLISASMIQHVNFVTHNKGHILDLVITQSGTDILSNLRACMELPSDHAALICYLDFPRPESFKAKGSHRKIKQIDLDSFDKELSSLSLFDNNNHPDVEVLVTEYITSLRNLLDKHAPLRERTITVRPHSPWFSEELRHLKVEKRRCERKWLTSGLEVHKQIYRDVASQYYSLIEKLKINYYRDHISSLDQKKLFKFIDGLFKVKSSVPLPTHTSALELAQRFDKYFLDKVANVRKDIADVPLTTTFCSGVHVPTSCSLSTFAMISVDDVQRLVKGSPCKSCSLDPLPSVLLKQFVGKLCLPITKIVNLSLKTGEFPSSLKHALVTPLIKKPSLDPEELKNYRPISNLSFLSKTIERVVAMQLNEYLQKNDLHSKMQSAYRPNHSTETALLRVYNDINLALDQHHEVLLVLLDLSSAFDTIDHGILLDRLKSRFGLDGAVLKWIGSYLSHRTQSIIIDGTASEPSRLDYGVPQGSVLGPLLFSLYVSPLDEIVHAHNLQLMIYADDTQLYLVTKSSQRSTGIGAVETCAYNILQWMGANKLMCNSAKTEVLHFQSRYLDVNAIKEVTIGESVKQPIHEARDLGVILDRHLRMSSQVNNICKSASQSLRRIGQIRKYLDAATTEKLIHAFITSKLDYCNSLLFGLPDKDLSKLQRIQNSAARMVTLTGKFEHITPVLRSLHWLPVKKRIIFKILLMTFKVLNGLAPEYLNELLQLQTSSRTLRSNSGNVPRLNVPLYRTETYGRRGFATCAPRLWNSLPNTLKSSNNIESFKKELKTHLFDLVV